MMISKNKHFFFSTLLILFCSSIVVFAQSVQSKSIQSPAYDMKENQFWTPNKAEWVDVPVFKPGAKMKVIHGDPSNGPSDLYIWFPKDYGVQWHFHTPTETLYMQTGTMEIDIRETGQKETLSPGAFLLAPSRSVHRATCKGPSDCYFFVHSTGPFDINIVDETGKVIKSGPNTEIAKK